VAARTYFDALSKEADLQTNFAARLKEAEGGGIQSVTVVSDSACDPAA
jgi:hypothetical protein